MVKDNQKEKDIFYLFNVKNFKPIQIASRLKMSKQSVNYYIKKMKLEGKEKVKIFTGDRVVKSKNFLWRAEAAFFKVKPFYDIAKYKQIRTQRGNYGIPEGNYTLMLYRDYVRIQLRQGVYFKGATKEEAVNKLEEDFNAFINKINLKYGFYFLKEGRVSIKLCSFELAKENCKIAKQHKEVTGNNYYLVKDTNGKVCFKFDRSTGVLEREYIGKETIENAENGELFFQDIFKRFNENPVPYSETVKRQDWILNVLNEYATNMKTHVEVMKEIKEAIKELNINLKGGLNNG